MNSKRNDDFLSDIERQERTHTPNKGSVPTVPADAFGEVYGKGIEAKPSGIEPQADTGLSIIDEFYQSGLWIGTTQATPVGLIFNDDINVDDFEEIGKVLLAFQSGIQWCLGDWLNYGDNFEWGTTYQRLADFFEVDIDTIRKYKQTAALVEIRIRNPHLSFSHHRVIAHLPLVRQKEWLAVAAKDKRSVAQLRKGVQEEQRLIDAEKNKGKKLRAPKVNVYREVRNINLVHIKGFQYAYKDGNLEEAEQHLDKIRQIVDRLEGVLNSHKMLEIEVKSEND